MFTTFFTKAAASSGLYSHVSSWFNKKKSKNQKPLNVWFQSEFCLSFRFVYKVGWYFCSYKSCVWVVLLCHQSLVVHDVFKCLTGKAARRQIRIPLWKVVCRDAHRGSHRKIIKRVGKQMFDSPVTSMVVEVLGAVYQLLFWLINIKNCLQITVNTVFPTVSKEIYFCTRTFLEKS